jgi:hypothetical protein
LEETGVKFNNGATWEEISDIETKLQFVFSDSFKNFYTIINGFKDRDMTYNLFSIWPLEKILEEYVNDDDKNFIPFCDFLLNSHWHGFLKDKQGIFKSYDTKNPIASTFEEAIELIYIDSNLIY